MHGLLLQVFPGFNVSPSLALSFLREYNFRWNTRMMVSHGMIPKWMGDFFLHHLLEDVQEISKVIIMAGFNGCNFEHRQAA